MKKKEVIFIAAIVLLALALWAGMYLIRRGSYGSVRITVDGQEYGTYSLAEDQTIAIGSTNTCEIRDGKVKMIQADCPDQLCIRQHAIGSAGGTIVCLPNKVVIEGQKAAGSTEEKDGGFDTVV